MGAQFHSSARLLVAAFASLRLIIWTLMGPGMPPLIVPPGAARSVSPCPILVSAVLATTILVDLSPIGLQGSWPERGGSLLLGVFPFLVLSLIVLWTAGVSRRGSC